jgi:heme A synthase
VTRFTVLAGVAVASTFILVVLGAVVRTTGSGLGCPEWPTCHGSWVPPLDDVHAIIEWSHRTVAAITGVLIAALAITAVVSQRNRPSLLWPSLGAAALVIFQAWLGKLAVESELSGDIVTAHLATAMALLALLVFVFVRSRYPAMTSGSGWDPLTVVGAVATLATYGLLLLGAHVRATGTSLAFPDWPLMNGMLLPGGDPVVLPQVIHRWTAVMVAGLVVWFAWLATLVSAPSAWLVRLAALLFAFQIAVGGIQILTGLAPLALILHVALGAGIFGLLVAAWLLAWYGPVPEAASVTS